MHGLTLLMCPCTRAGSASRFLWVGNLLQRTNRAMLKVIFEPYGALEDVVTFPGRQYAFVSFRRPEDAVHAVSALQDRPVRLQLFWLLVAQLALCMQLPCLMEEGPAEIEQACSPLCLRHQQACHQITTSADTLPLSLCSCVQLPSLTGEKNLLVNFRAKRPDLPGLGEEGSGGSNPLSPGRLQCALACSSCRKTLPHAAEISSKLVAACCMSDAAACSAQHPADA